MISKIRRASITLPTFQHNGNHIGLPGVCIEQNDLGLSYVGVLIPGIGLVFRLMHEATASGVMIDMGEVINLEIPSQLLPNITQYESKINRYFAEFIAERSVELQSNSAFFLRNFVPGYSFSQDTEKEFLRGMTP